MNVRIYDKHVNMRLSWQEVVLLEREGWISNMIQIGENEQVPLIYSLEVTDTEEIQVCFAMNRFRFMIPQYIVHEWIAEFNQSREYDVIADGENNIRLSIEPAFSRGNLIREKQDRAAYMNFVN